MWGTLCARPEGLVASGHAQAPDTLKGSDTCGPTRVFIRSFSAAWQRWRHVCAGGMAEVNPERP